MKKFILSVVFICFFGAIYAQETTSNSIHEKQNNSSAEVVSKNTKNLQSNTSNRLINEAKVCYSETSKTAFYEVLISNNGFNIDLKNSTDLVIKNTEEIISKKRDEVLYSEKDE
ncbi:hypothetical protein [Aquimarina litoralis]|uniref:hypothetical protein n=1 Tax=Aquimarina litoralis TaxID=584605 RepID=UPI001C57D1F6|nr:hypothetical protein [Aquimarina litoralis]MBW1294613.1 hypothetical protein [Aquimarina litoralis]